LWRKDRMGLGGEKEKGNGKEDRIGQQGWLKYEIKLAERYNIRMDISIVMHELKNIYPPQYINHNNLPLQCNIIIVMDQFHKIGRETLLPNHVNDTLESYVMVPHHIWLAHNWCTFTDNKP
jgi:hypothetical protein